MENNATPDSILDPASQLSNHAVHPPNSTATEPYPHSYQESNSESLQALIKKTPPQAFEAFAATFWVSIDGCVCDCVGVESFGDGVGDCCDHVCGLALVLRTLGFHAVEGSLSVVLFGMSKNNENERHRRNS